MFSGFSYLYSGFKLLIKPGIWPYVIVPLLLNILVLVALVQYSLYQFDNLLPWFLDYLPDWLSFMEQPLQFIFVILLAIIVILVFSVLANLLGAPFNAFLAAAVQKYISGHAPPDSGRALVNELGHAFAREVAKLWYYFPRALLVLCLSFIPLVGTVSIVLWVILGAWMMAVQYLDYPMDNNGVSFSEMLTRVKKGRFVTLGFGGAVLGLMMIPLLNFMVMPAAVSASVLIWKDRYVE